MQVCYPHCLNQYKKDSEGETEDEWGSSNEEDFFDEEEFDHQIYNG
jgi:hypothetical protein